MEVKGQGLLIKACCQWLGSLTYGLQNLFSSFTLQVFTSGPLDAFQNFRSFREKSTAPCNSLRSQNERTIKESQKNYYVPQMHFMLPICLIFYSLF